MKFVSAVWLAAAVLLGACNGADDGLAWCYDDSENTGVSFGNHCPVSSGDAESETPPVSAAP